MEIDLDGPEPLYEQIADMLSARIAEGTYEPRRRIPSEAALCEEFSVSRPTVRAAVKLLNDRGLTVTVRGKGTFVAEARPESEAGDRANR
ncbi:GntR family transcriptional regulator [Nocardiopsis sp. RSe5-2]|uniref:GntR family transcriptional regulator n=1 Tax=Nocardiopsis endophytica TaxID=3018445 RepID=A0ABT4U4X5_9ACTN|nr:GntR family transcriptional regulator [Nocardiopsis endophytica]MDA2812006.1 GntR family transcriptional regulator [Nocardiopsis endophytica]